jgi:hypothetical protein
MNARFKPGSDQVRNEGRPGCRRENNGMATRERRLAEFNGNGEPPPGQPVQVLCEDHSGTYQLPFPCRFINGEWRNDESGSTVEATVVGWRLPASSNRTRV